MPRTLFLFLFVTAAFFIAATGAANAQPLVRRQIDLPQQKTPEPQSDTLTAGVFTPGPTVLKGATRDLADLDIRLITLRPGKTFHFKNDSADYLLIVKDGNILIDTDPAGKSLGPGGIELVGSSYQPPISNRTRTNASFYILAFRSRAGADTKRTQGTELPFIRDWPDLVMKKTDKGESRAIFSQPTTWLKNINMHATTLNPGEISHPQHMHRAEEILLLRSGNVRMHIAGGYIPAKGGDLVFLPSGVPHDLENGPTGRAEYFALQWEP